MKCEYGSTSSDSRGTYVKCPSKCGCGDAQAPRSNAGLYVVLAYLGLIGLCLLGVYFGLKG